MVSVLARLPPRLPRRRIRAGCRCKMFPPAVVGGRNAGAALPAALSRWRAGKSRSRGTGRRMPRAKARRASWRASDLARASGNAWSLLSHFHVLADSSVSKLFVARRWTGLRGPWCSTATCLSEGDAKINRRSSSLSEGDAFASASSPSMKVPLHSSLVLSANDARTMAHAQCVCRYRVLPGAVGARRA